MSQGLSQQEIVRLLQEAVTADSERQQQIKATLSAATFRNSYAGNDWRTSMIEYMFSQVWMRLLKQPKALPYLASDFVVLCGPRQGEEIMCAQDLDLALFLSMIGLKTFFVIAFEAFRNRIGF